MTKKGKKVRRATTRRTATKKATFIRMVPSEQARPVKSIAASPFALAATWHGLIVRRPATEITFELYCSSLQSGLSKRGSNDVRLARGSVAVASNAACVSTCFVPYRFEHSVFLSGPCPRGSRDLLACVPSRIFPRRKSDDVVARLDLAASPFERRSLGMIAAGCDLPVRLRGESAEMSDAGAIAALQRAVVLSAVRRSKVPTLEDPGDSIERLLRAQTSYWALFSFELWGVAGLLTAHQLALYPTELGYEHKFGDTPWQEIHYSYRRSPGASPFEAFGSAIRRVASAITDMMQTVTSQFPMLCRPGFMQHYFASAIDSMRQAVARCLGAIGDIGLADAGKTAKTWAEGKIRDVLRQRQRTAADDVFLGALRRKQAAAAHCLPAWLTVIARVVTLTVFLDRASRATQLALEHIRLGGLLGAQVPALVARPTEEYGPVEPIYARAKRVFLSETRRCLMMGMDGRDALRCIFIHVNTEVLRKKWSSYSQVTEALLAPPHLCARLVIRLAGDEASMLGEMVGCGPVFVSPEQLRTSGCEPLPVTEEDLMRGGGVGEPELEDESGPVKCVESEVRDNMRVLMMPWRFILGNPDDCLFAVSVLERERFEYEHVGMWSSGAQRISRSRGVRNDEVDLHALAHFAEQMHELRSARGSVDAFTGLGCELERERQALDGGPGGFVSRLAADVFKHDARFFVYTSPMVNPASWLDRTEWLAGTYKEADAVLDRYDLRRRRIPARAFLVAWLRRSVLRRRLEKGALISRKWIALQELCAQVALKTRKADAATALARRWRHRRKEAAARRRRVFGLVALLSVVGRVMAARARRAALAYGVTAMVLAATRAMQTRRNKARAEALRLSSAARRIQRAWAGTRHRAAAATFIAHWWRHSHRVRQEAQLASLAAQLIQFAWAQKRLRASSAARLVAWWHHRHRARQLRGHLSVRAEARARLAVQVEYFFSHANLASDRFMQATLARNGIIPWVTLAAFPSVRRELALLGDGALLTVTRASSNAVAYEQGVAPAMNWCPPPIPPPQPVFRGWYLDAATGQATPYFG